MNPNSFSARYNCDKLVYFEEFENDSEAIIEKGNLKNEKRLEDKIN